MTPPPLPEEVTVRYCWNARAITEAHRWHQRRAGRPGMVRSLVLIGLLAGLGFLSYRNHRADEHADFAWLWWAAVGAAYLGLMMALRRFYVPWVMRRNLAKRPVYDSPMTWRITEDRLCYQHHHGKAELDWGAFMQSVQAPTGLLLYLQPLMFHWLPKASFASEEEYEQVVKWTDGSVPDFRPLYRRFQND